MSKFLPGIIAPLLFVTVASAQIHTRILNGVNTASTNIPPAALLMNDNRAVCSGTLVGPSHVLTAAHCAYDGNNRRVSSGSFSISINGSHYRSTEVTVHPSYKPGNAACADGELDAALIKLSQPIRNVSAIPLLSSPIAVGSRVMLVGYGVLGDGYSGESTRFPQLGTVNYGYTTVEGFGSPAQLGSGSSYFYFVFDAGEDEANTGSGDSGGPAFVHIDGSPFLAGITCGGDSSAKYGTTSYHTRADLLAPWVKAITTGSGIEKPPAVAATAITLKLSNSTLSYRSSDSDYFRGQAKLIVPKELLRSARFTITIGGYAKTVNLSVRQRSIFTRAGTINLSAAVTKRTSKSATIALAIRLNDSSFFAQLPQYGLSAAPNVANLASATLPVSVKVGNSASAKANLRLKYLARLQLWKQA